jgi:transcriptional regulator with XRE-family HTH domain
MSRKRVSDSRMGKLGATIRKLRLDQGITQARLADSIGVDESYISKIEKGKLTYTPSEETLRLMAHTLKVDPLELLSLAAKTPDELQPVTRTRSAREFFELVRGRNLRNDDWEDLTRHLRRRLTDRNK